MSDPNEPVDIDSLIFESIAGERRLGRPGRRDLALAERLIADRGLWQPLGGTEYLATVLAAVREGSTVEGARQLVGAVVTVSRRAIEGTEGDAERHATRAVWRRWSDELHAHALRPIGWPAVERTHLAFGTTTVHDSHHPERHGLVVVPADAEWTLLELRLRCEAVPA